jgi:hypothetical protein
MGKKFTPSPNTNNYYPYLQPISPWFLLKIAFISVIPGSLLVGTEFACISLRVLTLSCIIFGGFFMKRIVWFVLLGLSIVTLTVARDRDRDRRGGWDFPPTPPQIPAESVTITGNLTIAQGMLAVKNNDITYQVPGLNRFIGFIDALKDGAQVSLEGSAITSPWDPKTKLLRLSKLTINGKDYDMGPPPGTGFQQPMGPIPGAGFRQPMGPYPYGRR